jgi:hypothetical protein
VGYRGDQRGPVTAGKDRHTAYPVSGPQGRHRNGSQASDNPERQELAIRKGRGLEVL